MPLGLSSLPSFDSEPARFLFEPTMSCSCSRFDSWLALPAGPLEVSAIASSGIGFGISVKVSRAGSYATEDRLRRGPERAEELMVVARGRSAMWMSVDGMRGQSQQ